MSKNLLFLSLLGIFPALILANCGGGPGPAVSGTANASAASSGGGRLFTGSAAGWLYSAPHGSGIFIGGMLGGVTLSVNARDGGFDFPVQYADSSNGCVQFTDRRYFNLDDQVCVPRPASGFWPSTGGWGANDGHLVVVDQAHHTYYEFWKLLVDANGNPTSTDVGQVVEGDLSSSNGAPGTTASGISGLAGDILPGELDCATCLEHALSVIVPSAMNSPQIAGQAPASKTDGTAPGAIFRYGAKIRLDPNLNVDGMQASTAVKAILHALQTYGGVITDQTGGNDLSFYSSLAQTPDLSGLQQAASHLYLYY